MSDIQKTQIDLGAYQFMTIEALDLGEAYDSVDHPNIVIVKLTTAVDEPFVNRTVTAMLSEDAQRRIIKALQDNLARDRQPCSPSE